MPDVPAALGMHFRHFLGEPDYPHILAVMMASEKADRNERTDTLEDIVRNYSQLTHCDPFRDLVFAEAQGEVVGYGRVWWWDELGSGRIYGLVGFVVPAWRRKGIGRAMVGWMENRLREIAANHAEEPAKLFQVSVSHFQTGLAVLLERSGYQSIRTYYQMIRPSLEDIPEWPLPEGLEIRPAAPEHYRAIWESVEETSREEWGQTTLTEREYQAWLNHSTQFQPPLWQIAWDVGTQRVAGHVLTYIDHAENAKFDRRRGYTEGIGVGRAWRRRGLARALIARSLRAQRSEGMTESALVADSDSQSGVTGLYESCGFQVVKRDAIYRKPL